MNEARSKQERKVSMVYIVDYVRLEVIDQHLALCCGVCAPPIWLPKEGRKEELEGKRDSQ